jgi:putative restriction endonuclease
VRPDFKIEVRADILKEEDGPTLMHGIQGLHGSRIVLPRRAALQPGRELLERRYEKFRSA